MVIDKHKKELITRKTKKRFDDDQAQNERSENMKKTDELIIKMSKD
jgi:predicted DNA-binding WGR domain protein